MNDLQYGYEFVNRQQYSIETKDYGWKEISVRNHMGPIEQAEMHRADQIEALVAERQRIERRVRKGY